MKITKLFRSSDNRLFLTLCSSVFCFIVLVKRVITFDFYSKGQKEKEIQNGRVKSLRFSKLKSLKSRKKASIIDKTDDTLGERSEEKTQG